MVMRLADNSGKLVSTRYLLEANNYQSERAKNYINAFKTHTNTAYDKHKSKNMLYSPKENTNVLIYTFLDIVSNLLSDERVDIEDCKLLAIVITNVQNINKLVQDAQEIGYEREFNNKNKDSIKLLNFSEDCLENLSKSTYKRKLVDEQDGVFLNDWNAGKELFNYLLTQEISFENSLDHANYCLENSWIKPYVTCYLENVYEKSSINSVVNELKEIRTVTGSNSLCILPADLLTAEEQQKNNDTKDELLLQRIKVIRKNEILSDNCYMLKAFENYKKSYDYISENKCIQNHAFTDSVHIENIITLTSERGFNKTKANSLIAYLNQLCKWDEISWVSNANDEDVIFTDKEMRLLEALQNGSNTNANEDDEVVVYYNNQVAPEIKWSYPYPWRWLTTLPKAINISNEDVAHNVSSHAIVSKFDEDIKRSWLYNSSVTADIIALCCVGTLMYTTLTVVPFALTCAWGVYLGAMFLKLCVDSIKLVYYHKNRGAPLAEIIDHYNLVECTSSIIQHIQSAYINTNTLSTSKPIVTVPEWLKKVIGSEEDISKVPIPKKADITKQCVLFLTQLTFVCAWIFIPAHLASSPTLYISVFALSSLAMYMMDHSKNLTVRNASVTPQSSTTISQATHNASNNYNINCLLRRLGMAPRSSTNHPTR